MVVGMLQRNKAQSSVEVLVIFLLLIIAFIAVISTSSTVIFSVDSSSQHTIARKSLDDLASAADRVRSQGTGAAEKVIVRFPTNLRSADIVGSRLQLQLIARGSDYQYVERSINYTIIGSLPNSSGVHEVTVRSLGSLVRFS